MNLVFHISEDGSVEMVVQCENFSTNWKLKIVTEIVFKDYI